MTHPTTVVLVKFKTTLPIDEAMKIAEERADDFRALPGLIQKYYLHDKATGELAGLYLWESEEAFTDYRDSQLRKTIGAAYKTESEPKVSVHDLLMPLRA